MVIITGKNLGERQRDLNAKVAEVVANKKKIDEIKTDAEITDIDKLYEIDIALQYKNIDYIFDTLKCGDSLYISRALKCIWLYEDNYSNVINPENLQENLFPYMSLKMKKKMLSAISTHLRNESRAISFYFFCNKNKMPAIGFKFLNNTSEEFKLQEIERRSSNLIRTYLNGKRPMENFIKTSFKLATAILNIDAVNKSETLYNLRFLYSVSKEKYLNMIEQYADLCQDHHQGYTKSYRFGLRISRDIMINYKLRVLGKPILYISKLNQSVLIKYSTVDDAKKYVKDLMPSTEEEFWKIDFCNTFNFILEKIPDNERFNYVKQMFSSYCPDEAFEMKNDFYRLEYYKLLSVAERELWALRYIEKQKEHLRPGEDYIRYKFVNFDKALLEIKKYIMITPEAYKRLDMLNTLVHAVRDGNDLIKLLNYYYDRHVNENERYKVEFVEEVLSFHNIFKFDRDCWEALNKILYSLDVYTENNHYCNSTFVALAVCFQILYNQDMPKALQDFINHDINYSYFNSFIDKLSKEQSEFIFQYLVKIFVDKLEPFDNDPYNKELRDELRPYAYNISNLLSVFGKDEKDRPDIVTKFLDIDSPKADERRVITDNQLYRFLKTDVKLVEGALSQFEQNMEDLPQRLNKVLRKLKIYFSNDISKAFMTFFNNSLSKISAKYDHQRLTETIVFAIFQLADETYKIKFLKKYSPSDSKINYETADKQITYVQAAICGLVGYSRPPVPLENLRPYIVGDYTKYCLPLFDMYVTNLPLPLAIKFCEATLDAQISVQKHGLRAAFKCFSLNDLKNLIGKVWNNTHNISLRLIIYKLTFGKVIDEVDDEQSDVIYEQLKYFTSVLREDDHDDIFDLISSGRMINKFLGDYLRTAWTMVVNLSEKPFNVKRRIKILNTIEQNIDLVQREFVYNRIIKEHVVEMLEKRKLEPHEAHEINELYKTKWNITAKFISIYDTIEELEDRLGLVTYIFKRCFDMWNELCEEKYVYREFCFEFIRNIRFQNARYQNEGYWAYNVPVLQHILDLLIKSLPIKDVYLTVWELQLTICARIVLSNGGTVLNDQVEYIKNVSPQEISKAFANQVEILLKERIQKRQLYSIFIAEMAKSLEDTVGEIQNVLNQSVNFNILFCGSLASLGVKEAHLLALMLLPKFVEDDMKEYFTETLRKIQAFGDDEVQTLLYLQFVLIDYKHRF